MKTDNRFVSIVTLGNFNPAILKVNFLKDVCKIELGTPTREEYTPIQARVDYGDISFITNLDRFQIIENQQKDFSKSKISTYLDIYLRKLEYTPISACGINFNLNIIEADTNKLQNYFIKNKANLLEFFKTKEIIAGYLTKYNSDGKEEIPNYSIGYTIGKDIIIRITIEKKEVLIHSLTYNYEVRNLEKSRKNISILIEDYLKRFNEYEYFLNTFFK